MSDVIFMLTVVGIVVLPFGLFMSFCEWAHKENRVPFFVKWYKDWNRKEGQRRLDLIKKGE